MISWILACVIWHFDKEVNLPNPFRDLLAFLGVESTFLIIWLLIETDVVLVVLKSIYNTFTLWTDCNAKYLYKIVNVFFGAIFMALCVMSGQFDRICLLFFIFYMIFVVMCEQLGAFGRGDTEFFLASYCYAAKVGEAPLEMMLLVMLMASVGFGIFRKIGVEKEGYVAFTPYIIFSEYIINIIRIGLG